MWEADEWDAVVVQPLYALCLRYERVPKVWTVAGVYDYNYVEFHARSAFSFLEGASLPEAMVQQAANLGMPALGILDRDGLYGAPRLYTTAKKLGLRSHVGAAVSVGDLGLQVQPENWPPHAIPQRPVRLSLLCESQIGYRNLSQLITGYKLRQQTKGEGVTTLREVKERCEGLVCLTGGDEGPLAEALERGGMDKGGKHFGLSLRPLARRTFTLNCSGIVFGNKKLAMRQRLHFRKSSTFPF